MTSYHFKVKMTCSGCSGAINRVLSKQQNLQSYNVDLENQSVVVVPNANGGPTFTEIKEKLAKTGKEILDAREE
ncbi:unnamed protein product [Sympodiomycopsis kandeliae]